MLMLNWNRIPLVHQTAEIMICVKRCPMCTQVIVSAQSCHATNGGPNFISGDMSKISEITVAMGYNHDAIGLK